MTAIELRGVDAGYDAGPVLTAVDLVIEEGSWVALIGPNGAGKSTLLRAIAGEVRPTAGRVRLRGSDAVTLSNKERARLVAVVPQEPVIPGSMRALDYVVLGRTPHLGYFATEGPDDVRSAFDAMAALDVDGLGDRPMGTLSGGERRRVVLARALCQDSPILLLDEPTAALDLGHQQQVFEVVDELRATRGLTVVMAVHDLTMAAAYVPRLVMFDEGRIVADGSAETVLTTDRLARFGDASVAVLRTDDGGLVIVPLPRGGSRQVAAASKSEPTK